MNICLFDYISCVLRGFKACSSKLVSVPEREPINASNIGLFVGFESCPRYLKQAMGPDEGQEEELSVLLSEAGEQFEEEILDSLQEEAAIFVDAVENDDWILSDDFSESLFPLQEKITATGDRAIESDGLLLVYQMPLRGQIGAWPIKGQADLVALWSDDETLHTHVIEIKSSTHTQPYHEIQAALYANLLRRHLEVSDHDLEVEAGIVHRETDELDGTNPESFPAVDDLSVVEGDVNRLLREGGIADEIAKSEDVTYRLSGKCNHCLYNEACFSKAVGDRDLALLGLTEGEQRVLNENGIASLDELASLKQPPEDPSPDDFRELDSRNEDKVQELMAEPAVGDGLDEMVQRAQAVLGEIDEHHPQSSTHPWLRPLQGCGDGTLPDDQPTRSQQQHMDYQAGELVRVYLYLREDYMRDSLAMLSARVDRTNCQHGPLSFSAVAKELSDDQEEQMEAEGELLTSFLEQLFASIQAISDGRDEVPMHLYFFSRLERDSLVDSIKRHMSQWDVESLDSIRDLLGLRQGIDQPMVSVLQEELQDRFSLKYTSSGLLPVLEQAYNDDCRCGCGGDHAYFGRDEWRVEREDGTSVDLWQVFNKNFFNYRVPYVRRSGEIEVRPGVDDPDGFYPARARFDNQIPLEYIWCAAGKLDESWARSPKQEWEIRTYTWHDANSRDDRITTEDLDLLGQKICQALEHIEHTLSWHHEPFLGKEPIPRPEIPTFDLGDADLRRASQDYIDLEHFSSRQESLRHFARSPRERLRTGKSAIIRVEDTERRGDDQVVRARLVYRAEEFADPQRVANACRIKGVEGATSGTRLVANQIEWNSSKRMHEDPYGAPTQIEKGVPMEVMEINIAERRIRLRLSDFHRDYYFPSHQDFDYVRSHKTWTFESSEARDDPWTLYFESGDRYILDPKTDDWTSEHSQNVYEAVKENPGAFYQTLQGLLEGRYE